MGESPQKLTLDQIVLGKKYYDRVTRYLGMATEKTEFLCGSSTVKLEATSAGQADSKTFYVGRLMPAES